MPALPMCPLHPIPAPEYLRAHVTLGIAMSDAERKMEVAANKKSSTVRQMRSKFASKLIVLMHELRQELKIFMPKKRKIELLLGRRDIDIRKKSA
jgi:hypothetical protein